MSGSLSNVATGVGMIGQYIAGNNAADAAEQGAQAQLGAQQDVRNRALESAKPTAMELGAMNAQMQQAGQSLKRQQALFDAIDPALIESGKQALELLQGKSAATVAPMLAQRQQQRAQLEQKLQQQLGPGAAASSAGAQALSNFDLQTSNYQAQLQQGTLGMLLGQANNTGQSALASGNQAGQLFGAVAGQAGNIQNRMINANLGSNTAQYAGAPFVGDLARAKNMGQLFGQISQYGGKVGGMPQFGGGSPPSGGGSGYGAGTMGSGLEGVSSNGVGNVAGGGGAADLAAMGAIA